MKKTRSSIQKLQRLLDKGFSRRRCAVELRVEVSTLAYWIASDLPDYAETPREKFLVTEYKKRIETETNSHKKILQEGIKLLNKGHTLTAAAKILCISTGSFREALKGTSEYIAFTSQRKQEQEERRTIRKAEKELLILERKQEQEERRTIRKAEKDQQEQEARKTKYGVNHTAPLAVLKRMDALLTRLRATAKHRGIAFDLRPSDLYFPITCPVLGLQIDYRRLRGRRENIPSFDRIDHRKGYIKGNVIVISWRANRIRSNGLPDEHLRIARFYRKLGVV